MPTFSKQDDEKIKTIINKHPLLSQLNANDQEKLIALLVNKHIGKNQVIVKEGDLIDSIYFILDGIAEVHQTQIIASLTSGEIIGFSDIGFYSNSGKRSASVIAMTDMELLKLDIGLFNDFISKHLYFNSALQVNAEMILRMKLIKDAIPFKKLSFDEIRELAEKVTSLHLPANQIIFNKNDPGNNCYLIQAGSVEIFLPNMNDSEKQIALLHPPQILGETALLLHSTRNASARTKTNCQLLVLKAEDLLEIVQQKNSVATALMTLLKNRSRPLRLPHIEAHFRKGADQQPIIILKDSLHLNYYELNEEAWFVWQLLDGNHTLREISLALYQHKGNFNPSDISALIMDLEETHFIEKIKPTLNQNNSPTWFKMTERIQQIMEASISFGNVDKLLTQTYQKVIRYFFTVSAQLLFIFIISLGFYFFISYFSHQVESIHHNSHATWLAIFAFLGSTSTLVFHELAHAYTTKFFGYQVHSFGIGWYWIGPIAFCDTSDMWLSTRWAQVMVDLAGIYMDLFIAGIASILAVVISNTDISAFFWLLALFNYLSFFTNLSPLLELDGYYVLLDLSGKDNLRDSAIIWLIDKFPKHWRQPKQLFKQKAECFFWIICIVYLIFQIIFSYVVANILLYSLLGISNPYLNLLIILSIISLVSANTWGQIQKKRNAKKI